MRVLVTGGTGYLGRSIVRACEQAGHHVVAFSRTATRGLPGIEALDGDVRDADAVSAAVMRCDAVCHSAALVGLWRRRRADFDDVNVGGLRNVLKAARAAGTTRIVYTSSFLALPPNGHERPGRWNDYQRTKVLADVEAERAAAEGAPIVRLYPGVIYGPGPRTEGNLVGRSITDHLAGRLPGVIGADRSWSFAWIEDVAAAHAAALEKGRPGERYAVGGENARQMAAYEIVRGLTGKPLPRRIPLVLAVAVALAEESRAALTGRPPRLTIGTVEILSRDWALDSRRAEEDLGYRVTPLRDGIRRVVDGLRVEPGDPVDRQEQR